jgi:hypothetical protein
MKWTMFLGHAVLLLSVLLMMACALTFKFLHQRRRRRAPLQGRKVGNLPGQQLLERISHHAQELDTALSLMYMAFPLMFMVWLTLRVDWRQVRFSWIEAFFIVGALATFGWGLRGYVRHYRAREQMRDGWTAEHVTGMQLNRLVAQGCLVLHDLPAEYGNIDHVVIAPRGVYSVETKSFRKPRDASDVRDDPSHQVRYDGKGLVFPDFATREPIEQALRQAQWLRRFLRDALNREVPVIPAVALPGWYVVRTDEGKRADVQVFSPMGKGPEFMAWDPERVAPDVRRLIAEHLASRYPVIDA